MKLSGGAWRAALPAISIADLARSIDEDYGLTALAGIRTWLSGPGDGDTAVVERG